MAYQANQPELTNCKNLEDIWFGDHYSFQIFIWLLSSLLYSFLAFLLPFLSLLTFLYLQYFRPHRIFPSLPIPLLSDFIVNYPN